VINLNGTRGKPLQTSPKAQYQADTHPRSSKNALYTLVKNKNKTSSQYNLFAQRPNFDMFWRDPALLQEMKSTSISTQQQLIS
jgi:hypothetical protein